MQKIEKQIDELNINKRLDACLASMTEFSRTKILELIKQGKVLVNGKASKANYKVKLNDIITFEPPQPKSFFFESIPMDLDIVYEDDYLLIVNKRRGLVVHPSRTVKEETLLQGVLHYLNQNTSSLVRPGLVHRLDKYTEGLLVISKNDQIHSHLANQIETKQFKRSYVAVVHGTINNTSFIVDSPIGPSTKDKRKMEVNAKGKNATTEFEVISTLNSMSIVKCNLITGRTHQIRVHLSSIGNPIVGDPLYGKPSSNQGQALCSNFIEFVHPITKKIMAFSLDIQNTIDYALSLKGV